MKPLKSLQKLNYCHYIAHTRNHFTVQMNGLCWIELLELDSNTFNNFTVWNKWLILNRITSMRQKYFMTFNCIEKVCAIMKLKERKGVKREHPSLIERERERERWLVLFVISAFVGYLIPNLVYIYIYIYLSTNSLQVKF